MSAYPTIVITGEMIDQARKMESRVAVNRTIASDVDTLAGILGEMAFAQWFYGDWQHNSVGKNKGQTDFVGIEIKTSAFPFRETLHLLVREDYAQKRKPAFYVQVILNIHQRNAREIPANTPALICGWATYAEVDNAPKKDWGSKGGGRGGYLCHAIPIKKLHPMSEFRETYQKL